MRAALLREKLVFLEETKSQSPSGFEKKEWAPVYRCKAYKKNTASKISSDEMNAKEVFKGVVFIFQVRNCKLIKTTQRVEYNNEVYQIDLLDPRIQDNTLFIHLSKVNQ